MISVSLPSRPLSSHSLYPVSTTLLYVLKSKTLKKLLILFDSESAYLSRVCLFVHTPSTHTWDIYAGLEAQGPRENMCHVCGIGWPVILACWGMRSFLGCGTFSTRAKRAQGKLERVGHPRSRGCSTEGEPTHIFKASDFWNALNCNRHFPKYKRQPTFHCRMV